MTDPFIELVSDVLKTEGGYTNDAADAGGETNYGITAFVARSFGYSGRMADMTRDQAVAIYKSGYWEQPGFDIVWGIDAALSFKLFDIGVNMGQETGVKFLQRALNCLNQQGSDYQDLTIDGNMGNMTLTALKTFIRNRGQEGRRVVRMMVTAQQSVRYIELAESRPVNERFEFGWQSQRAFAAVDQGVA